jgi:hypothetical protein
MTEVQCPKCDSDRNAAFERNSDLRRCNDCDHIWEVFPDDEVDP